MTKQEKIDEFLAQPLKVGDYIMVLGMGSQDKTRYGSPVEVKKIIDGVPYVIEYRNEKAVDKPYKKWKGEVGENPFVSSYSDIRSINFELQSILFQLFKTDKYDIEGTPVKTSNDNPYVFVGGEKKYYQRPLVWSLEDKQLLVESIYNFVDCGKILVRNRGWKELELLQKQGHELAWKDIVDGKQRINAVKDFIDNKFPDLHGNYYVDLSDQAQRRFTSHQLFSYSELPENTKDEDVLRQFLKLNFAGVPQSKEHLEYIKSLLS